MTFIKTTEQSSKYEHLEKMSVQELLFNINQEDKTVPFAVEKALPQISLLVAQIVTKMQFRCSLPTTLFITGYSEYIYSVVLRSFHIILPKSSI